MDNQQAQITALELILFYLQNQNVTADLQAQGLSQDEIELVQQKYIEFVDVTQDSLKLWKRDTMTKRLTQK